MDSLEGRTDEASGRAVAKKRRTRGQWTKGQRRQMVAESRVAGARVREVAQRHGVRPNLLSTWRRYSSRVRGAPLRAARFAAVRMSAAPLDAVIEIDLTSHCIRVRGVVDSAMLREVLAATR